ncbi:MAG TPA: hypothetical protein PKV98_02590 [Burkholderiaceae bacterium]|nr:hypothetical protein [Burkholderiaceae bacterium]
MNAHGLPLTTVVAPTGSMRDLRVGSIAAFLVQLAALAVLLRALPGQNCSAAAGQLASGAFHAGPGIAVGVIASGPFPPS